MQKEHNYAVKQLAAKLTTVSFQVCPRAFAQVSWLGAARGSCKANWKLLQIFTTAAIWSQILSCSCVWIAAGFIRERKLFLEEKTCCSFFFFFCRRKQAELMAEKEPLVALNGTHVSLICFCRLNSFLNSRVLVHKYTFICKCKLFRRFITGVMWLLLKLRAWRFRRLRHNGGKYVYAALGFSCLNINVIFGIFKRNIARFDNTGIEFYFWIMLLSSV